MSFMKLSAQQPICRHLRTKASYVPALRSETYMTEQHPMAQYFCLRTLHAVGPDDKSVCPEDCTSQRICFVAIGSAVA